MRPAGYIGESSKAPNHYLLERKASSEGKSYCKIGGVRGLSMSDTLRLVVVPRRVVAVRRVVPDLVGVGTGMLRLLEVKQPLRKCGTR
jgi:hypothetical protein